jgi:hypothetical protein
MSIEDVLLSMLSQGQRMVLTSIDRTVSMPKQLIERTLDVNSSIPDKQRLRDNSGAMKR